MGRGLPFSALSVARKGQAQALGSLQEESAGRAVFALSLCAQGFFARGMLTLCDRLESKALAMKLILLMKSHET